MRSIREAFAAVFGFPGRSAVSVLAITMALILFGVFGLVAGYTRGLLDLLRKGEEISVYLEDSQTNADMLVLDSKIAKLPEVETTRVVSKEDAAAEFERIFGENLLSAFEDNPLPRSIVVTVAPGYRTARDFDRLGRFLNSMEGVESAEYGREWMAKMDYIFVVATVIEGILGVLVGIAGIIVIANSIRLAMITRRETIGIMRLVGATEAFIHRPFYFEGAILGLLAGMLASGVFYGVYFWAGHSIEDFEVTVYAFGVSREMVRQAAIGLALLIPAGMLLGLFGSRVAMRKAE